MSRSVRMAMLHREELHHSNPAALQACDATLVNRAKSFAYVACAARYPTMR